MILRSDTGDVKTSDQLTTANHSKVWQKAHQLTLAVYRATAAFPKMESFGLVQQMRRAAASVPTNIAEGTGRGSDADFARFLWMANGSVKELDYQLLLSFDLGYVPDAEYQQLLTHVTEVKRMLAALIGSIKANS